MKRLWMCAVSAVVLPSSLAFAEAETPIIDQRQSNQQQRIDQGIASGQLTERESNRMEKRQEHIQKLEDKAKSDGVVTRRERARIGAAQNSASDGLAREKHDRQGKRHR